MFLNRKFKNEIVPFRMSKIEKTLEEIIAPILFKKQPKSGDI